MNGFLVAFFRLITAQYSMSILVAVESVFVLLFIQKIFEPREKNILVPTIFLSIFNGALIFGLIYIFGPISSALYMLGMILLTNVELIVLGRGTPLSRLYVLSITSCDYSCLYVFSLATLNFCFRSISDISIHIYYYRIAFCISILATLIFASILLVTGKKVVVMFRAITQSVNHGKLVLSYNWSVTIIMFYSAFIMLPEMMSNTISKNLTAIHSIYEMLVSLLLLVVSFVVIFVQYQLKSKLDYERTLRSNIQRNALLSYSFNATKDTLDRKIKFFKPELWEGDTSYFKMIRNFIKLCVHTDDQEDLFAISSPNYSWDALAAFNGTSLTTRFRISAKEMIKFVNLPDDIKAVVDTTTKEWRWSEMTCVITKAEITGNVIADVSFVDVDDKISHERELEKAANIDKLTGILNRGAVEATIKNHLAKQKVEGALFIIDLDHFKEVNDILGHIKGDELLKETAQKIASIFRTSDIIGRLGGDEFIVFCKDIIDKEFLSRRAKELNEKCYTSYQTDSGEELHTSLSIGIAICPKNGQEFEMLYRNADVALYKSKTTGKNKTYFYAPGQEMYFFDFENDGLKLGIPEIDEQHKKLVDLTNDFMKLVLSDEEINWSECLLKMINEMLSYSQEHFTYEEKLMAEYNFALLEEHKKRHNEFLMYTATQFAGVSNVTKTDALNVLNFLREWLVNHVAKDDKLYVNVIPH